MSSILLGAESALTGRCPGARPRAAERRAVLGLAPRPADWRTASARQASATPRLSERTSSSPKTKTRQASVIRVMLGAAPRRFPDTARSGGSSFERRREGACASKRSSSAQAANSWSEKSCARIATNGPKTPDEQQQRNRERPLASPRGARRARAAQASADGRDLRDLHPAPQRQSSVKTSSRARGRSASRR